MRLSLPTTSTTTEPMRLSPPRLLAASLFLAGAAFAAGAATGSTSFEPTGFVLEVATEVPVPPAEAFDAFTGDVSGWWDHHFAPEPAALVIEPRVGGTFHELFGEEGEGVIHGEITWCQRGERLVIRGPFGFHGMALDLVHTISFEATEGGTRVAVSIHANGEAEPEHPAVIERVWNHFLVEQYRAWVEAGRHREG